MAYKDKTKERENRKAWRLKNLDRRRITNTAWRERSADRIKEVNKAWKQRNPEKVKEINRQWRARNKEKLRNMARLWRKKNQEKARYTQVRYLYGLEKQEYDVLISSAGGNCQICGDPWGGKMKRMCVDHCHNTKKVRGLLCDSCNTAIGKLKEDPVVVLKAYNYLMKGK